MARLAAPRRVLASWIAVAAVAGATSVAHAAPLWWDNVGGTTNDWGSVNNWSTTSGGGSNPAAIPGASDVATFNATSLTAAQTVNLFDDRSVQGLEFLSTLSNAVALQSGGGLEGPTRTLTIGSAGVTNAYNSGTGEITIGTLSGVAQTAGTRVNVVLNGDQTWQNSGSKRTFVNEFLTFTGTNSTLTHTGTGTGRLQLAGSGAVTGSIKFVQDSATSEFWLRPSGSSTYSGGVEVRKGVVFAGNNATNFGTGTLTLGNAAGGSDAASVALQENANVTFANAIALAPNTTGTLTIELREDTIATVHTKTFTGGITGSNNLTLANNSLDEALTFSTGSVNNAGSITHTGTYVGAGTRAAVTTISAVIGSNVTGVTQSSTDARLVLSNTNTYSGPTTINAGTLDANGGSAIPNASLVSLANVANATLRLGANETIGNLTGGGATGGNVNLQSNTLTVGDATNQSYAGAISGGGGFTKQGSGISTLSGTSLYTGATTVSAGQLAVDGSIATSSGVSVASGATLGGSGRVSAITGAGIVAPGNSPGILTGTSVNISTGMDFKFEFTQAGAPTWASAISSGNDVLRLTSGSTPISGALTSANVFDIYFPSISGETTFQGGLFTDRNVSFDSLLSAATFNYFIRNPLGPVSYGGFQYSELASGDVTRSTVQVPSANFSGGTITNGYTMQFVVVPEPAGIALAGIGVAAAALVRRLCRRDEPAADARS